ncbi:UNVERIFIED_CONTAM: protein RALF-like 34 [Sesamum calycinum]|uniref:Protein RALF-like 34 n=1 Tax=Sesamum calycinum TaxID=2727403 RepID=A0AAW2MNY9_9LAMI
MDSAKYLLFSLTLLFTVLVAAAQLADESTFQISADAPEQWGTGISFYNEELGEGMEEEAVDGAPNRRSLFWKRAIHYYISYGALSANRVPCPPRSASVVIRRQNRHGMNTHVVKIANRECSCGKWNQFGIPCSHAQKVCGAYNISAASMVKDYYDLMAYNNTYSKHFEPVQSEDYWDDPNFQLVQDPTIRTVRRPGRNQTTRIHNEMDWRQTRARQEAQQQQGDSSIQENVS